MPRLGEALELTLKKAAVAIPNAGIFTRENAKTKTKSVFLKS